MIDYAGRRARMVERQLRGRGIEDERVLAAMEKVPRHRFVAEALADRAYADCALPIGEGQTISQPFVVARTVSALELTGSEKVLEVGAGSGYQAAVLAECARRVFAIERIASLASRAQDVIESLGYTNLAVRCADGTYGWAEHAPYDAIAVAAAGPTVPEPLVEQLAEGGRLVMPVGSRDAQVLRRYWKTADGLRAEDLEGVAFVPLIGKFGVREDNGRA